MVNRISQYFAKYRSLPSQAQKYILDKLFLICIYIKYKSDIYSYFLQSLKDIHSLNIRYNKILSHTKDGVWEWSDLNDNKQWWSDGLKSMLDCKQGDATTFTALLNKVHIKDKNKLIGIFNKNLKHDNKFDLDVRLWCEDEFIWHKIKGNIYKHNDSFKAYGVISNINQHKIASLKLEKYNQILELSVQGVVKINKHGKISTCNKSLINFTNFDRENLLGQDWLMLVSNEDKFRAKDAVDTLKMRKSFELEMIGIKSNKAKYHGNFKFLPYHNVNNEFIGFFLLIEDVSEKIQQKIQLEKMALIDSSTSLPNRIAFNDKVESLIKDKTKFGIIIIDLDGFKNINATFGHAFGDLCLIRAIGLISRVISKNDFLARLGGDEFGIIVQYALSQNLVECCERLKGISKSPIVIEYQQVTITFSIGAAHYPTSADNGSEIIQHAHMSLNYSKSKNKNTYTVFEEKIKNKIYKEVLIKQYINQAIHNNELELVWQPQLNIITNKWVGAEVLIRWNSPVLGEVYPQEFIPIIEKTGDIVSVGKWVLTKASEKIAYLQANNIIDDDFKVAINCSTVELLHLEFVNNLLEITSKLNVARENIVIEITETSLIHSIDLAIPRLKELSKLGIRVAIDDFGTGYSSLHYLLKLPIDFIKIDRSFIIDLKHNKQAKNIVSSIISLAQSLGMLVIAEGVSNTEEFEILKSMNCNQVQGFFISYPLSWDNFHKKIV